MKRKSLRITRYIIIGLMAAAVGLIVANAVKADAESDAQLAEIDSFIESHTSDKHYKAEIFCENSLAELNFRSSNVRKHTTFFYGYERRI